VAVSLLAFLFSAGYGNDTKSFVVQNICNPILKINGVISSAMFCEFGDLQTVPINLTTLVDYPVTYGASITGVLVVTSPFIGISNINSFAIPGSSNIIYTYSGYVGDDLTVLDEVVLFVDSSGYISIKRTKGTKIYKFSFLVIWM